MSLISSALVVTVVIRLSSTSLLPCTLFIVRIRLSHSLCRRPMLSGLASGQANSVEACVEHLTCFQARWPRVQLLLTSRVGKRKETRWRWVRLFAAEAAARKEQSRVVESDVFGWSRSPNITRSRSRIFLSDSGSPTESFFTCHSKVDNSCRVPRFPLIASCYNIVDSQTSFMLCSRSRKFWKGRSWTFYLRLRNPDTNATKYNAN